MTPPHPASDAPPPERQQPPEPSGSTRLDESRYPLHRLCFAGGLLAFLLGLLLSGAPHAACLLGGGLLLAASGVLGLLLGRNVVIDLLRDAVGADAKPPAAQDSAKDAPASLHHTSRPIGPTAEDRRHAHLVNAIYLLVGLWWLVMGATWWLD